MRLNHDALERLEVGLLSEHMHPPDRSVKDVINKSTGCDSGCSWHHSNGYQNAGSMSILVASLFPSSAMIMRFRPRVCFRPKKWRC